MSNNFLVRLCLLLTLCTALGCQPAWSEPLRSSWDGKPIHTMICVDVPSDAIRYEIKEAIAQWSRSLSEWRVLDPRGGSDDEGSCDIFIREVPYAPPSHATALAWTSMIGGREIFLVRGRYESIALSVVLHEIGHALGAQHVHGTLMNREYYKNYMTCPDVTTVAQVAAWNRVNLEHLSWCSP